MGRPPIPALAALTFLYMYPGARGAGTRLRARVGTVAHVDHGRQRRPDG